MTKEIGALFNTVAKIVRTHTKPAADHRHRKRLQEKYQEKDKEESSQKGAGKIHTPSFEHALAAYPKEKTKIFKGDGGSDDEGKKKKKKGKGKGKKGGSAAFGNKAANLGAYVV
jgi:hypothetical protein